MLKDGRRVLGATIPIRNAITTAMDVVEGRRTSSYSPIETQLPPWKR